MPRKADPKCLYCARNYLSEQEAQTKHPDCYIKSRCYSKRYRLLHANQVNAKRRQISARKRNIQSLKPILPDSFRAELLLYGKENLFVHAVALQVFQGNQLSYTMSPQHTHGMRQHDLEDYIQKLLLHLHSEFGIDCFGLYYWLPPEQCEVCRNA